MSVTRGGRRAVLALAALMALTALTASACTAAGSGGPVRDTATLPTTTVVPSGSSPSTASHPSTPATTLPTFSTDQRAEPSLPVPMQEAAAASTGDRLYVVGGYDSQRNSSAAVFVLSGSSWRPGPALPIAVNHPGAAAVGGRVYVAGGFTADGGASKRVFVLERGAAAWREVASLRRGRGALALVAIGGKLLAIGGRDHSVQVAVPESFDPATGTWSDRPAMPAPRNHVAGYVDGSLVCVAGGRTPDTSAAIDCFDPATSTWTHEATLPIATSGAAAVVAGGVTVVAGGEPAGETSIVGVLQVGKPGGWASVPMRVPRHGTAFATYHGRFWMCGGATAPGFHAVADCTSFAE